MATRKNLNDLVPLLFALVLSAIMSGCNIGCWFVPCDKGFHVVAKVSDPSGAPLAGTQVVVLGGAGQTDKNGCVELEGVTDARNVDLNATLSGYKPYDQTRAFGRYSVDIVLEPVGSPKASSATWKAQRSR